MKIGEDGDSLVGINDVNSNIVPKESCFSKQKKILIISTLVTLFIIILIIVIIFIPKSKNKKNDEEEPYEPHFEGDILGIIECIHEIRQTNDYTLILGDKFDKNSIFDIQIEGKSIINLNQLEKKMLLLYFMKILLWIICLKIYLL